MGAPAYDGNGPAIRASAGFDALPEIVEGEAVVEGRPVDHLAVAHLHHPRIAVVVRAAIVGDAMPVPHDDDGVPVGVDRPDVQRAKALSVGESRGERSEDLVDELLCTAVLPRGERMAFDPPHHVRSEHIADRSRAVPPGLEGVVNDVAVGVFCVGHGGPCARAGHPACRHASDSTRVPFSGARVGRRRLLLLHCAVRSGVRAERHTGIGLRAWHFVWRAWITSPWPSPTSTPRRADTGLKEPRDARADTKGRNAGMDTTVGADTLEELSRDPYPVYRRLREEGACVWLDAANRYGCRD